MKARPKYKVCRSLGEGVFEKCQTQKFQLAKARKTGPMKTNSRRRQKTEYGQQLLEKQKIRVTYGISERQFANYVAKAKLAKKAGEELLKLLETRLDNVVYRAGLAPTRRAARQCISHGHINVNGKRVSIPSYSVKTSEKIALREGSRTKGVGTRLVESLSEYKTPEWINLDTKTMSSDIIGTPSIRGGVETLDFSGVIEFYSRV